MSFSPCVLHAQPILLFLIWSTELYLVSSTDHKAPRYEVLFTSLLDCFWNVMAHAQKPDFVFLRNVRIQLNRQGRQFNLLLAAEMCASAVVMLDTPCSEVVWRVLAAQSIRQFPLHFPSRASPCAITFQLGSTSSLLGPNIFLSPLFSNTLGIFLPQCEKPSFTHTHTHTHTHTKRAKLHSCIFYPVYFWKPNGNTEDSGPKASPHSTSSDFCWFSHDCSFDLFGLLPNIYALPQF